MGQKSYKIFRIFYFVRSFTDWASMKKQEENYEHAF